MTNSTFDDYARGGFGPELLPIIPPDATINPSAPDPEALRQKRGKVPGRWTPRGWFGFTQWTRHVASSDDRATWSKWGAGVGLQGRKFPGVDIDVDHAGLAGDIQALAGQVLGDAPCRFGNGARRLLVYSGGGLAKRRIEFRGAATASVGGATSAVEILGDGQQYVVEGTHPKTLKPYWWSGDRDPAFLGADALRRIDDKLLDVFEGELREFLALRGYEVLTRCTRPGRRAASRTRRHGLLAPNVGAIARALAALPNDRAYDEWIMLLAAIKASAGAEREGEAFELAMDWSLQWPENTPEGIEAKWRSIRPPYSVGWDTLAHFAEAQGDGTFFSAHEDFDVVMPPPEPGQESKGPLVSDKVERAFGRYVWVERLKRMCDLETGELLDREQFNVRNSHFGDPTSAKECAWAVLTRDTRRLQAVKSVTYRPGAGVFVEENLPGLVGRCVNRWRDPTPDLPATASDADVEPWLKHVEFVIPDERERGTVLDWLAWVIQHPGEKPNWALVIGSTVEGMGKDMMMEPVRVALGAGNIREIGPDDLISGYSDFIANSRLLLVEEMQMSERKAMMNRLKPLVAAPPYTLRVNIKFEPQYEVPNIVAAIFFTNMDNALSLSKQDRRYFVTWNHGQPRDAAYYEALAHWYAGGGAALAARWLMTRDVSSFKAKGRAPETAAKGAMRLAAMPDLEATVHDGLTNHEGPFARRLVTVGEVAEWVRELTGPFRPPSPRRLVGALKSAGAIQFDRRPSLGAVPAGCRRPHAYDPKQVQLFAMPGDGAALELLDDLPGLRALFWAERLTVDEDFSADEMFGDSR